MPAHFARLRGTMLFNESIKSKYTKKNYNSHIEQFKRFVRIASTEDLLTLPREKMQILLEDYLLDLKRTTNPNSIPSKFQGIRHLFVMNRVSIDWNIIHKMFPQRQKTQSLRAYTDEEINELLSNSKHVRDRALIHFMTSTGARIGVFDHKLTLKYIQNMPNGCKAVKLYAGEVEEYWAFLTPQAATALDSYHDSRRRGGEKLQGGTPVFATCGPIPKQLTWNGARTVIYRAISRGDIYRQKREGRYDVQACHGFRKRFNTILKLDGTVNYNVAEKMMGHRNGLDGVYFVPTMEEMFAEFQKVMHRLQV